MGERKNKVEGWHKAGKLAIHQSDKNIAESGRKASLCRARGMASARLRSASEWPQKFPKSKALGLDRRANRGSLIARALKFSPCRCPNDPAWNRK
jgi:hypothetical protein